MQFYFDSLKKGFFSLAEGLAVPENCKVISEVTMQSIILELEDSSKHLDADAEGNPVVTDADVLTLPQVKNNKILELNRYCDIALEFIKSGYPRSEIDSWAKQEIEARKFIEDSSYDPQLLRSIAGARAVDLEELALKVVIKADLFANIAGSIIGHRQRQEDRVKLAATVEEVNAIKWEFHF